MPTRIRCPSDGSNFSAIVSLISRANQQKYSNRQLIGAFRQDIGRVTRQNMRHTFWE